MANNLTAKESTFPSFLLPYLGSVTSSISSGVTLDTRSSVSQDGVTFLSLSASREMSLEQTLYERPHVNCSFRPADSPIAHDLRFLGFQTRKFARPVRAFDTTLNFEFITDADLVQPPCALPLFIFQASSQELLLLAPCNSFHEQVLAVHDGSFQWGWSGDLKFVPKNFNTTLAAIVQTSPREALRIWAQVLRENHVFPPRSRYADITMSRLSYWTDNGAAYWYRREADKSLPESIASTVHHIQHDLSLPIAAVELDSWFYPHQVTRDVQKVGYLHVVPPTGMLLWEPREDVLGHEGIYGLYKLLHGRPLILHSRHISAQSPYVKDVSTGPWWVHGDGAHPQTSALWHRFMEQAATWGAITFEQDWICDVWFGTRQLREAPGRVTKWQSDLDNAARLNGLTLIWCMATPADMLHAATLQRVVAIRSCDDYRYADDPSTLWRWHLVVSCIIHELGLFPYKDVFMSHGNDSGVVDINGDPNAHLEACLAAFSAGPVGIGDRLGRTNPSVVSKCCRLDGLLVKPDIPMRALDRSLRDPNGLLWADTVCGEWRYVLAARTGVKSSEDPSLNIPLDETLELSSTTKFIVYDWNTKEVSVTNVLIASLKIHEWKLWVVCPTLRIPNNPTPFTLLGDTQKFVTMGDRRIRMVTEVSNWETAGIEGDRVLFEVLGSPGENVEISYWSEKDGISSEMVQVPLKSWVKASLLTSTDEEVSICLNVMN